MTYINKLILIYQFPNQDFISRTDYNILCTVIASANVPPQGKRFLLFKHDQIQMGLNIVTNDTFSSHLNLMCKWWNFMFRMILNQSICTENQSGDNSFITWHLTNRQTCTNTVNWGNLLVTIFAAPYLDKWHFTLIFYPFKTFHHRNAIAQPAAPYFANIAPYLSRYRDKSQSKESGCWPDSFAK